MTRLWMCGFEQGHIGVANSVTGVPSVSALQKRTGAYSWYGQDFNYGLFVFSAGGVQEIYGRVTIYRTGGDARFFQIRDSANADQFTFHQNTGTHFIEAWRGWDGGGGVLLATGTIAVPLNGWCVFEFRLKIDNVNGICQTKMDGVADINYAGDTQQTANANVSRFQIPAGAFAMSGYFDDIAINDIAGALNNSWCGQAGIYGIVPTGVGAHAQWTPSAGANWDCVDEVPPSDADFVNDATSGHQDSYAMANTPGVGIVDALCYWARAKKDLVGDKDLKRLFVIGGIDYAGAALALPTAVGYVKEILETSPDTLVPFTTAEIDAMEAGQEVA